MHLSVTILDNRIVEFFLFFLKNCVEVVKRISVLLSM